MRHIRYIFILLLCIAGMASAQENPQRTSISGVVVDGDTGETLPFVQIYFLKSTTNKGMVPSEIGTTTNLDGYFIGHDSLNVTIFGMNRHNTEVMNPL